MGCQGCTFISYLDHSEADDRESDHGETEAGYQWEHRRQDCFKTIFSFQILFKTMEKFPEQLIPQTFKFCSYLLLFFFWIVFFYVYMVSYVIFFCIRLIFQNHLVSWGNYTWFCLFLLASGPSSGQETLNNFIMWAHRSLGKNVVM